MPIVLAFLQKYWKQCLGAVVVLTLGGYIWFINHSRASLTEKNRLLTIAVTSLQQQVADDLAMINKQNASIDELKKKGDDQRRRLEKVRADIAAKEEAARKRLLEISQEKIGDTCEDALTYLRLKAKELSQWPVESSSP